MRYYLSRKGVNEISNKVKDLIQKEKQRGLDTLASCHEFKKNCELSKEKTLQSLFEKEPRGIPDADAASCAATVGANSQKGVGRFDDAPFTQN